MDNLALLILGPFISVIGIVNITGNIRTCLKKYRVIVIIRSPCILYVSPLHPASSRANSTANSAPAAV